uniref:RRM domain-containing protein n=1 Tax=Chromera velia CCMP2878 TaxID=1169474 RepID=A0A0G4G3A4_9ALVE|eukprot:Cvel_20008.t1-p1 / transcript=Cvel_20008.t1 / gene=Cvel_20008 / organism=Chromera_velia_CCMP2878 / gene_product=hypothetical protein / transcript_product=hypothetical protein / location=Cvel_scaffold1764:21106-31297(-) / protein_length=826 / sequence_SO=supercontig / SO=protein_coding / is_pseudo=false
MSCAFCPTLSSFFLSSPVSDSAAPGPTPGWEQSSFLSITLPNRAFDKTPQVVVGRTSSLPESVLAFLEGGREAGGRRCLENPASCDEKRHHLDGQGRFPRMKDALSWWSRYLTADEDSNNRTSSTPPGSPSSPQEKGDTSLAGPPCGARTPLNSHTLYPSAKIGVSVCDLHKGQLSTSPTSVPSPQQPPMTSSGSQRKSILKGSKSTPSLFTQTTMREANGPPVETGGKKEKVTEDALPSPPSKSLQPPGMAASPVASARFEAKFGALRQDRIHAEQLVIIFGGREQEDWKTLDERDLQSRFSAFGTVKSCKLVRNSKGVSRAFGFVSFTTHAEALAAIEGLNERILEPSRDTLIRLGKTPPPPPPPDDTRPSGSVSTSARPSYPGGMGADGLERRRIRVKLKTDGETSGSASESKESLAPILPPLTGVSEPYGLTAASSVAERTVTTHPPSTSAATGTGLASTVAVPQSASRSRSRASQRGVTPEGGGGGGDPHNIIVVPPQYGTHPSHSGFGPHPPTRAPPFWLTPPMPRRHLAPRTAAGLSPVPESPQPPHVLPPPSSSEAPSSSFRTPADPSPSQALPQALPLPSQIGVSPSLLYRTTPVFSDNRQSLSSSLRASEARPSVPTGAQHQLTQTLPRAGESSPSMHQKPLAAAPSPLASYPQPSASYPQQPQQQHHLQIPPAFVPETTVPYFSTSPPSFPATVQTAPAMLLSSPMQPSVPTGYAAPLSPAIQRWPQRPTSSPPSRNPRLSQRPYQQTLYEESGVSPAVWGGPRPATAEYQVPYGEPPSASAIIAGGSQSVPHAAGGGGPISPTAAAASGGVWGE